MRMHNPWYQVPLQGTKQAMRKLLRSMSVPRVKLAVAVSGPPLLAQLGSPSGKPSSHEATTFEWLATDHEFS